MKKINLVISVLVLTATTTFAQISDGDIKLFQNYFGAEKIALVKEYMGLTTEQETVFWPEYNAYEAKRQAIMTGKIKLIEQYMNKISTLSEADATALVDDNAAFQSDFLKLQKEYFKKMSKSVGPVKAAQFYQLESYLNNLITLTIQEQIPFVGELDKKYGK